MCKIVRLDENDLGHIHNHPTYVKHSTLVHLINVRFKNGYVTSVVKNTDCDVHNKCGLTYCGLHVTNGKLTHDDINCLPCVMASIDPETAEAENEIMERQGSVAGASH